MRGVGAAQKGAGQQEARRRPARPLVHTSSRRSLLLGSCGCVCCGACGSSATRNQTLDRLFASAMSDGMKEYEDAVAPLKRRLFSQLLTQQAAAAAAAPLQVLELGIGTGPNLPFYGRGGSSGSGGVSPSVELTGVDPNAFMLPYLRDNAAAAGFAPDDVRWIEGTAEDLPLADATFDAVVCTLASAGVTACCCASLSVAGGAQRARG